MLAQWANEDIGQYLQPIDEIELLEDLLMAIAQIRLRRNALDPAIRSHSIKSLAHDSGMSRM